MARQATRTRHTSHAIDNTSGGNGGAVREPALTKAEYERVADFRYSVRRLLRQTELEAAKVGITPQHYQLMLAVKGFPGREWASITELAERLQIRHNAVIGLVNRAEARGLLERRHGQEATDRRIVQIHLTHRGEAVLQALTDALRSERQGVAEAMGHLAHDAAHTLDASAAPM